MAIYKKLHKRSGVEFYYIRFEKQDGRRKKEKAGTTLDSARRLLKKRLGQVTAGTYVDPNDADKEVGPTFAEFGKKFLADYGNLRRSGYYANRVKILGEHFGERQLREITRGDLDRFALERGRHVGPSTVRKDLTVLGTMFRRAVRWGILETSPAVDLDKPAEPRHRTRYLSREEYRTVRDAAPPWLRPMFRLAVVTGFRLKELVGLRWDDIDREGGVLHVSEDNKTATPRAVPIGEVVTAVLGGQVRRLRSPYVFLDSVGKPYTSGKARNDLSKAVRALMKAQGVQEASFHTLRHTAGSWAGQAGESELTIRRFLGHASASVTERYVHLNAEHFKGIVQALDKAEQAAGAPQSAPQAISDVEGLEAKVIS